ncbi:flagellar export protein FliJ [Cellulomonas soli]
MSRLFPLGGLLRLRGMAEDRAAAELAGAHSRHDRAQTRAMQTEAMLRGTAMPDGVDLDSWRAVTASRIALGALLVEREDEVARALGEVDVRTQAWSHARRETRALERLAERHEETVRLEENRAEQLVLDEVAGRTSPPGLPGAGTDGATGAPTGAAARAQAGETP